MYLLKRILSVALVMLICMGASAQNKKKVSLEDVFKSNTFSSKSVYGINWMNDGQYYSSLVRGANSSSVVKINVASGKEEKTLIDGSKIGVNFSSYSFNSDETKALIASSTERIYRRSSKSVYHVVDLETGDAQLLVNGEKIMYASLSPDNDKVAYVKDNNLFFVELASNKITQVTQDGKWNQIINGSADWVYEEEFSMAKAFDWSPDGKKLAFIRFDETDVPEFNMQTWGELYPQDYKFKYPKAGEKNAEVSIHVYDLASQKIVNVDSGDEKDIYLPRIYWTNNTNTLAFLRLNRLQNQLDLFYANTATGESQLVLQEKSDTYVDLNYNDNLYFLKDNKGFIRTSEQDGFKHIYHHEENGKLIRQITSGNWEVSSMVGVDENANKIYFVSTEASPLERNLYVINLNGKNKKILTAEKGTHSVNMSKDFKYFIGYHSDANSPSKVTLNQASGKQLQVLEDNQDLKDRLKNFAISEKEFFDFQTVEGTSLNAYMIKPSDFDPAKKYPVLMYVYGGPGSQNVTNSWGGTRDFWHHHLAAEGYIVVCVDNRGTGARGRDFKHSTYANLGKIEVEDQIAGARYLGTLPYVDKGRIGIWGWSYGGYMSSLSLMIGNDVFKSAIAVAPVTTWRYYDTIYTERYLQTPQLNAAGYDDNSPITHVNKLKGNLLLIHGTGDDNVHFQNAVDLVDALIKADKQFDSFYYPNRNHGISGGNTSWHLYNMMTDFIKNKL
ncbi:dipeptidyl aminopeptidase/acylaminoacyl peptidase [Belliella baltica DSM 15883]|uniref:Dipeptidyl aminopeptidase/acylaminoacyl peptidase n=1 Tax=Belliella baltica (strain DSM 15883 / CIP 108006 / LMG 21964 / BA134) TaxID=866536 RepID=I3Z3R7_BELBD|nr:S9 family peptidase [Belliella baltica]AFL83885.1 dipeptidyl aminopeptidase/acylaminoacyl peptidase [Belliella baltica DSM 15883]